MKMWDIRSAKGSLMVLDQHNGYTRSGPESGEGLLLNTDGLCCVHTARQ